MTQERMPRPFTVASPALFLLLIGCSGQPTTSASSSESASATSPPNPSASASATSPSEKSVVCEWFAADGPRQKFIEAFAESITAGSTLYLQTLRVAITATEKLASRASGEERNDLLALAEAIDGVADDTHAWRLLVDEFYVRYAEQCGA
jgi:hypothetical protein